MTTSDMLYTFLRRLAEAGQPMPDRFSIADALGIGDKARKEAFDDLVSTKRIRLQKKMGQTTEARRVMFPDGICTAWTVPPKHALPAYRIGTRPLNHDVRVSVTADEQRMIADAVAAGRVKRCPPAYQPQDSDFYRRVSQ